MHLSKLTIENFRLFGRGESECLELSFEGGLTALVGENDAGKTAVIDALRFALGTTDQEWYRLEDTDFNVSAGVREIRITCKFKGLSARDKRAYVEYLTYGTNPGDEPVLYLNWIARDTGTFVRGRPYRQVESRSGENAEGPEFASKVRDQLRATYLRPLRDAEQALSAGRGSRLAQVLAHSKLIREGTQFSSNAPLSIQNHDLSVPAIAELVDSLLAEQKGVKQTSTDIDAHLNELALYGESVRSKIKITGADGSPDRRIRQMLEKLDLALGGDGKLGLGSNNLLFMACELLLLAKEDEGLKLLLIEEPEAHLHAQRQLRAMRFLEQKAREKGVQVIVTTHSPNLASAINLENIVMIQGRQAFCLARGETKLEKSDYRFLQRFLDVTKANLFFARAVVIVEGDAENVLLPTLAKLIGRDFTDHGVSLVNVGGVGLRRYAKIFQRKYLADGQDRRELAIPVACITDMDVMPDCAPVILGKVKDGSEWPDRKNRRWRAKQDIGDIAALDAERAKKIAKASGQCVKTFVSDEWTLEYDLALGPKDSDGDFPGGLAEEVFIATCLADEDDALSAQKKNFADVKKDSISELEGLKTIVIDVDGCTTAEVLATHIYGNLISKAVSKPISAQYLAELLIEIYENKPEVLRAKLPKYLVDAIEYVTPGANPIEDGNADQR